MDLVIYKKEKRKMENEENNLEMMKQVHCKNASLNGEGLSFTAVEEVLIEEDLCLFEKAQLLSGNENYDDALMTIKEALKMNAVHDDEVSLMYATDYQILKGQIELHLCDYKSAYKSFECVANNPTCYDDLKTDMEVMMEAIGELLKNE
ncbi:MAG: hypothetical protein JKY08_10055 [Flavobacteriaceae bacterium]|nr:hypothetical protein [Flavobacteriaceae bacterium]